MTILTGSLTFNPAFLREIKEDDRHLNGLLAALRDLTGDKAPPRRCRIIELLGELRDQLAFHFALEEAFGYFEDAVDVAPRVAERADELRAEHCELFEFIREIAEEAEQWRLHQAQPNGRSEVGPHGGAMGARPFRRVLLRFRQFDQRLQLHEQQEGELVTEALETDIGGEG